MINQNLVQFVCQWLFLIHRFVFKKTLNLNDFNVSSYMEYRFRTTDKTPTYTLENLQSAGNMSESQSQFSARFAKPSTTTAQSLANIDNAGKITEDLSTYGGILQGQREAVNALFVHAEAIIASINTLQREAGVTLVENIPLPTQTVRTSHSKKLGYIKLALSFVGAGLNHFMEQNMEYETALAQRDTIIGRLASSRREIDHIGELSEISIDDLTESSAQSVAPNHEVTPPTTPKSSAEKTKNPPKSRAK